MSGLRAFVLSIVLLQDVSHADSDNEHIMYFIKASEDSSCSPLVVCLTLNNFVQNALASCITVQFEAGNHTLSSRVIISNIEKYSMISNENHAIITCAELAGFTLKNISMVTLTNLTFIGCGNSSRFNAVLQISHINIRITKCTFLHSKGRVIEAIQANITTLDCTFKNSSAGVFIADQTTALVDIGGYYIHNTVTFESSALLHFYSSSANFSSTVFYDNVAKSTVIHTLGSTLTMRQCQLRHNKGSTLVTSSRSTTKIYDTNLTFNSALYLSLVLIVNTSLSMSNCMFAHNRGQNRATILHIRQSIIKSCDKLTITNTTSTYGYHVVDIRDSEASFGKVYYSNNSGPMLFVRSKATFSKLTKFDNNKQLETRYTYGGAITSFASIIRFQGKTSFSNHIILVRGSTVYAVESRIYANGVTQFSNNNATRLGGALYLDQSDFICQKSCTFIRNTASKGGAIYATNSIITIGSDWSKYQRNKKLMSSVSFISNRAHEGGAIYLQGNSKLRTPREHDCTYVLKFDNNAAKLGGAIFVNDYTNVCEQSTCFIQAPLPIMKNDFITINSTDGNSTIYGGLLDRCIAKRKYTASNNMIGINYLTRMTKNPNISNFVTSSPVRVCYCIDRNVDCSRREQTTVARRGQAFHVAVAAVDQVKRIIDAPIFIKSTENYIYHLGLEQSIQAAHKECTNLTLNVFSPNDSIKLILSAKGPCQEFEFSQVKLQIGFENCTCPIGFQQQNVKENCVCGCHPSIRHVIKTCNQDSETLLRQGDFWINYVNFTGVISYLIYPHCPYHYCLPSTHTVSVNLNTAGGSDAQCASNRTGLICSSCRPGFSLSLGSSHCLLCPNDWPKLLVIITVGAVVSGVMLVAIILVLNLTTAVGTLNGLIFYANIVASNNISYDPLSKSNFFSVFVAWLNLELGLDTCFYNGLDTYAKVWLQFAFPAYLIVILFIVIVLSKHSPRFAKLIGRRNPIATLATIILLSYMKFLRNIIDILSIATLSYPDKSHELRWLPDANIRYLRGKHIPLVVVATFIIALGLVYTTLLLTWQWLVQAPNHKLLGWIRNTRLHLFMEANVAACTPKHRYWTGLCLLIRVLLYLEIAYDTSREMRTSLFATSFIAICLLFVKIICGCKVYRKKIVDSLDSFSYLNLAVLSIAQLYSHHNKMRQIIFTKVSASAAFLQLLFVLTYHIYDVILEIPHLRRLKNSSLIRRESKLGGLLQFNSHERGSEMQEITIAQITPTSTEIRLADTKEVSAANYREIKISGRVSQSLTSNLEESNSLREPLLHEP